LFWHGVVKVWQFVPEYPHGQMQVYVVALVLGAQVAPFRHGLLGQALIKVWQKVPE